MANKPKLKFYFHNPNTVEDTADYILKILIDVNRPKVEQVLREEAERIQGKDEKESHSV